MNSFLESILESGIVHRSDGTPVAIRANTSRDQCEFIQRLIREVGARRCLEIGLAHGVSAIAACELSESVTTIDPYEQDISENIGVLNIERAGYSDRHRHFEEFSQNTLPQLLAWGERFDFAYVDTTKVFDSVLVDAFYITQLLRIGGIVVFDDCNWPGVRKTVRYLTRWPHLEVYATHGESPSSRGRRLGSLITRTIPLADKVFRNELRETDEMLKIAAGCIAFRKVSEDRRPWDWPIVP